MIPSERRTLQDDAATIARARFVGRRDELARFGELLAADHPRLWWVFGPGGIGKSRLLAVFAADARAAERTVVAVDLRTDDPSADGVIAAVRRAADEAPGDGVVVILDSLEQSDRAERWLGRDVMPMLPSGSIVVVGSRRAPSPGFRADPSWSTLLDLLPLRGLSSAEGAALLEHAGVTSGTVPSALRLGRGHPLALRLLADTLARPGAAAPRHLGETPDVVAALLARVVDEVPDEQHRQAIELSALSRVTTRSMLRDLCDGDRGDDLFSWLAAQPWVERLPQGLCPHDLARDIIVTDLRTNDPDRYARTRRALRRHVLDPTRFASDPDRCASQYLYLHRYSSVMRSAWDWSTLGNSAVTRVRPGDRDALASLVATSYGERSVVALDHWLERQPHGFVVLRSPLGEVVGVTTFLTFTEPSDADLAADPSVRAVWRRVLQCPTTRSGELVGLSRFVCDRDAGPLPPSPTYNVTTIAAFRHWMTTPGLALDYIVKPRARSFRPMMDYIDFHPVASAEHVVGDTQMVVFEHDWRSAPLNAWLERMESLEAGAPLEPATDTTPVLVALDEEAFAAAVRSALRDLSRPDRLADNPLVGSRVVLETGEADAARAVERTVRAAFEALDDHPRTERARRSVARTYLHGAVTQEAAAEVLDMAFSTYRRHLRRGIELLIDRLWRWELYGRED